MMLLLPARRATLRIRDISAFRMVVYTTNAFILARITCMHKYLPEEGALTGRWNATTAWRLRQEPVLAQERADRRARRRERSAPGTERARRRRRSPSPAAVRRSRPRLPTTSIALCSLIRISESMIVFGAENGG